MFKMKFGTLLMILLSAMHTPTAADQCSICHLDVIVAATAGIYAVGGMFSAWSQEFFIGNKRSLPYSTIAKRNAILGGVFGLITVGALTASLAKN